MTLKRTLCCSAAILTLLIHASANAQQRTFNLDAGAAASAIPEFARQAGIQILAPAEGLEKLMLPPLKGNYDVRKALELLLSNTNIEIMSDDGKIVRLRVVAKRVEAPNVIRVAAEAAPRIETAQASPPNVQQTELEEVIVTGSRIVREGYEAPTPLTVIGAEALEQNADSNMINMLSTMPAITGARTTAGGVSSFGQGAAGVQSLNLRSLGSGRVLVLLDGQRIVASTYGNFVDVATIPSQLVSRVDVVTGGASAVYGSDAVAGVVNFVLDRQFVGLKGEVSGGLTNYGDNKNYKVNLASGLAFSGGRGHLLLAGEHMHSAGIKGDGGRSWNREGILQMSNPTYTPTNGQPQLLVLQNSSLSTAAAGGLVVAGPLKGTAFGAGGVPYQFNYGPIVSGSSMSGGDWKANDIRPYSDMEAGQSHQSVFTRLSYDLADNVNVFAQWGWSQNSTVQDYFQAWMLGTATTYVVQIDNAFLPASTRAAMIANNITSFGIGSWNKDMPKIHYDGHRITNRVNAGLEGSFDAADTTWTWNAYYAYGSTKISLWNNVPIAARYRLAIDSVTNPATGQIVCRSVLQGANNGCSPWNPMGIGVNVDGDTRFSWLTDGGAYQRGLIEQTTMAASVTGEPFSNWAGPVSVAASAEHRKDEINAVVDPFSAAGGRIAGNFAALTGKQSVTEGALETIVPLAMNENWANAWDISAAVRFTDYELAGYVTTWKVGTTFSPSEDIKLRITRSRDIRAPNLQDLFAAPSVGIVGASVLDRFLNSVPAPGNTQQAVGGNVNLTPEKADTTGVGVVLSPTFLSGFTMSVDYWDVKIKGAIQPMTPQQVVDACFNGLIPALCSNIARNPDGTLARIDVFPVNLAVRNVRGIDVEASYRVPLSDLIADWNGNISLHGLMSYYFKNYQDTRFSPPIDTAGQNSGDGPPSWKLNVTATYQLDPLSVSLTGRAISSGKINTSYIECTSGCPAATLANPTVNTNRLPGRFYLDANVSYKLGLGDTAESDLFLSVRNLFNASMPQVPSSFFYAVGIAGGLESGGVYDASGTVYRAGIRFRM